MSVVFGGLFRDPPARRHEEDDLQRQVLAYLRWALPDDCDVKHTPNGGARHSKAAARLVGLGVRAGHPDLDFIYRGRPFCIELKAARGSVSAVQKQRHGKLERCGCPVYECRTLDQVIEVLTGLGVGLKVRPTPGTAATQCRGP